MSLGLIQGFMREAPLPDIIQLVSQGGKTGCFHVHEEAKRARIYLKDGRVVHAITNDAEGLDAVFEVALWLDGQYHFEETSADVPTTITKSNAALLMEMHKRMDEWRVISQKITSLDLYPQSTLLPGETASGVSPREGRLLAVCTGYYSINELAEVLQKPVLNLAKDIYGLVMANHVALKGLRTGKRPELPPDLAPKAPVQEEKPVAVNLDTVVLSAPAHSAPVVPVPSPMPPAPVPVPVQVAPLPTPEPLPPVQAPPVAAPPPAPEPPRAIAPVPAPLMVDPLRVAKLNAFAQRIANTAKGVLPGTHHDMVNRLLAQATQQVSAGEGPDAVKNLALSVSRNAVDSGLDADVVKLLNAQLKALFNK